MAVLYSGRFFGSGAPEGVGWSTTQRWASNHLEHAIQVNNASVFVISSPSNWCGPPSGARDAINNGGGSFSAAEAHFQADVRRAFRGWHDLHAALVPAQEGALLDGAYADAAMQAMKAELHKRGSNKTGHYGFVTAMMRN